MMTNKEIEEIKRTIKWQPVRRVYIRHGKLLDDRTSPGQLDLFLTTLELSQM